MNFAIVDASAPFWASLRAEGQQPPSVGASRINEGLMSAHGPQQIHSVFGSSSSASSSVGVSSISMRLKVDDEYTPNADTELVVV